MAVQHDAAAALAGDGCWICGQRKSVTHRPTAADAASGCMIKKEKERTRFPTRNHPPLVLMTGSTTMLHVLAVEPFGQVRRDVAGAVVGEKPWPVDDRCPVEPRGLQRQVQRGGDILGLHGWAQLPGDDVAREVVEDGRQVEPAPTDDL